MYDKNSRIKELQCMCSNKGLDALLITDSLHNRYLAKENDSIEGVYIVYQDKAVFFTDFRYFADIKNKNPQIEIIEYTQKYIEIAQWLKNRGIKRIGFESSRTSYSDFENWSQHFPHAMLVPCKRLVEELRMIKDENEIASVKSSIKLLGNILEDVPRLITQNPHITEKEIALEIDLTMRRFGADKTAFTTIVASGKRSAYPHAAPSSCPIQDGEILLVDAGAVMNGYNSDQTRTLVVGERRKNRVFDEIFNIVREAQEAAFSAIAPGVSSKEVDYKARQVIEKAGYGDYFGHGTGHGVGLEVHEAPSISGRTEPTTLAAGMIFTVEPAIYIPEKFGIRWEDMVLVTDTGYELLTEISWNNIWVG
ncbi:MAG: M24 family metallopeptidase [bacterium]